MEFANYTFNIDGYDGTLSSFTDCAHDLIYLTKNWSVVQYREANHKIMTHIPQNNTQKWEKAILLCMINIRLIWKNRYRNSWWAFDFDCILERLVKNTTLMNSTITNASITTIILNCIRWTSTEKHSYYGMLLGYPQNTPKAELSISDIEIMPSSKITTLIDERYWQVPAIGIYTAHQVIEQVCQLLPRISSRDLAIFKMKLTTELSDRAIGKHFELSNTTISYINRIVTRRIIKTVHIKNYPNALNIIALLTDEHKLEKPIYDDEHNLGQFNYLKIRK